MATLTNADVMKWWTEVYRKGFGKEEIKSLPNLPSATQRAQIVQAIEDRMVAAGALAKSDIETILGQSINGGMTKKLIAGWFKWRLSIGG